MMKNKYINPNWFIDQLTFYQSANSSNEGIKKNFLVRVAEFEIILADIRNKKTHDPLQHELILGRRGSGKSTLLRRIQVEIEEDKDLSERFVPINLAEEQAGIYRLSDLWFEVLQELMIKLNSKQSLKDFTDFESEQDFTRYLYAQIHQILTTHSKKVVLLLDNLDRILENFDADGHLLREILLNFNDIQIIGGSTRMDEHFWAYDQPFYEFFRRHRLEGLSFEEIHRLLNHWSELMDLPILKDYALRYKGKIQAIRIFTDGLPRALQFFIQILLQDSTLYGFDYLRKVMDRATPLYQERLNNLTAPQRKIVLEMAFAWEAVPTKFLVEKCRMESKLIASFLKQLEKFGIVEILKTPTKNHLYRISERFFNMWLIVTQGNPQQKRQAKYLTQFIEAFYDEQDIRQLTQEYIKDIQSGKYAYDKAVLLSKAFSQSKYISVDDRDALIEAAISLNEYGIYNQELPRKYKDILEDILKYNEVENYTAILELLDEIENEEDGFKFYAKGLAYHNLKNYNTAEEYYKKAIEKGFINALNNLANLYSKQGQKEEAEEYYKKAIDKGDISALYNLANLYREQGRKEEAEEYYKKAIEKGHIKALNNLANLYREQGRKEEAEEYYKKAIDEGVIAALYNLAKLYSNQGRKEEAEEYYKKAIEKGDINALNNLAFLYHEFNKNKADALQYILLYFEKSERRSKYLQRAIIEIWNNIFENTEGLIYQFLSYKDYEGIAWFFEKLLHHEQNTLVLSLFENEEHGQELRTRYELIYYATLILSHKTEGNLLLKIPPEVLPTVEAIVTQVKEKQAFYAQ